MFEFLGILNALISLWIVVGWIAVAIYTATVASAKGHRFGWWLIGGLVFQLSGDSLRPQAHLMRRGDDE